MTDSHGPFPPLLNIGGLIISLLACAVVFLPFAFDTSPLDAVMLRVPGNQGNWWHALVGAPFFLAVPMIWLRFHSIFSSKTFSSGAQRAIWLFVCISIGGTILVELPFLLHLAGTSEWQRLFVLGLGFGIAIVSGIILWVRRRHILPVRACVAGLSTAYLANAALCLVVYNAATGPLRSRSGWLITMVIVWPMALELVWIFGESFKRRVSYVSPSF